MWHRASSWCADCPLRECDTLAGGRHHQEERRQEVVVEVRPLRNQKCDRGDQGRRPQQVGVITWPCAQCCRGNNGHRPYSQPCGDNDSSQTPVREGVEGQGVNACRVVDIDANHVVHELGRTRRRDERQHQGYRTGQREPDLSACRRRPDEKWQQHRRDRRFGRQRQGERADGQSSMALTKHQPAGESRQCVDVDPGADHHAGGQWKGGTQRRDPHDVTAVRGARGQDRGGGKECGKEHHAHQSHVTCQATRDGEDRDPGFVVEMTQHRGLVIGDVRGHQRAVRVAPVGKLVGAGLHEEESIDRRAPPPPGQRDDGGRCPGRARQRGECHATSRGKAGDRRRHGQHDDGHKHLRGVLRPVAKLHQRQRPGRKRVSPRRGRAAGSPQRQRHQAGARRHADHCEVAEVAELVEDSEAENDECGKAQMVARRRTPPGRRHRR